MSDNPAGQASSKEDLLSRFFSFETLIGSGLIKFVYFAGLVGIGLFTLFGMFGSMLGMGRGGMGILGFILFPIMGVFLVVIWRFYCELAILAFQIYARMGEIRDRLPPSS